MHGQGSTERPADFATASSYGAGPTPPPIWSSSPSEAAPQTGNASQAAAEFFTQYARQRPEVVALWAFGIGFLLGWRLKPW